MFARCLESGIETLGNLLYWFPRRYIDRSQITPICQSDNFLNSTCTVIGIVKIIRLERGMRGRLRVQICDDTGSMELLWFRGVQFFSKSIHKDSTLLVTGKVTQYGHIQMVHPTIETIKDKNDIRIKIVPCYTITSAMREAGVQQKLLLKAIVWTLNNLKHFPQVLPSQIETGKNFPALKKCLTEIHLPQNLETLEIYRKRIKYEELYKLALSLRLSKRKFTLPGRSMQSGLLTEKLKNLLPFKLTHDQIEAINILYKDAKSPQRMHRLLQGDVGSGKTLVAFFSSLASLNEGFQVAWLTPTDVLANQTFNLLSKWLDQLGYSSALFKGGLPSQQKQKLISAIEDGSTDFIVGTHALLQPAVKFHTLGMIIIDEQHKFGAQQRLTMQEKDPKSDFLLMSATPIPQTLAKTLYGDLDIVTIYNLPQGRSPVSTHIVPEIKRNDMEQFVLDHINHGSQAYYIVPRIEHEDDLENMQIKDIESTFESIKNGTFSSVPVAHLHGKLGNPEKIEIMNNFAEGSIKVLVATSVVEVGIDVPNATIIIIENADRFGLAQLHQLRGRVGRGQKKSFCFLLLSDNADESARFRVSQFCKSNDGFKIAEMDLKLRGPGEVIGFKQSGWDELIIADIIQDADLFKEIQNSLDRITVT